MESFQYFSAHASIQLHCYYTPCTGTLLELLLATTHNNIIIIVLPILTSRFDGHFWFVHTPSILFSASNILTMELIDPSDGFRTNVFLCKFININSFSLYNVMYTYREIKNSIIFFMYWYELLTIDSGIPIH